jgi:flavin-dependent dehydrogenase
MYLRTSAEQRGVHCIWGTKLHQSSYEDAQWNVVAKSDDGKTQNINAKFVIDATGRQSHFARSLNVKRQHFDKLIACWATMDNHTENTMSTISASENGWWYSAVVPDNKRILAFQTDSDLIDKNELKTLESFLNLSEGNQEITQLLENNKSELKFHGTVAANSTRLEQVAGTQWAALGDAAISFDPLSSQGMFNAMASAMQMKDLIAKLDFIHTSDTEKEHQFQKIYTQQIDDIWNHYLQHKKLFYGAETRWKESEYWKRRNEYQFVNIFTK